MQCKQVSLSELNSEVVPYADSLVNEQFSFAKSTQIPRYVNRCSTREVQPAHILTPTIRVPRPIGQKVINKS